MSMEVILSQLTLLLTVSIVIILLLWIFRLYKISKYLSIILTSIPYIYLLYVANLNHELSCSAIPILVILIVLLCSSSCLEIVDYKFTPAQSLIYLIISYLSIFLILFKNFITVACIWLVTSAIFAPLLARARSRSSIISCIKYLVFSAIGATLLIFGISYLEVLRNVIIIPILLILFGIAYELGIVPLHVWIPDVYKGSDRESVAMLASFMKIVAILALCRVFYSIDVSMNYTLFLTLSTISIITMFIGNLGALFSKDIEHILAFSTIAQTGYGIAVLSVGFLNEKLLLPCLGVFIFHIISVAISKCALFIGLDTDYRNVRGISLIHALSLIGIPPLIGFWPKLFIILYILSCGQVWLAILVIANSVLSVPYYIKLYRNYRSSNVSRRLIIPLVILTALVIIIGIFYPVEMLRECIKIVNIVF